MLWVGFVHELKDPTTGLLLGEILMKRFTLMIVLAFTVMALAANTYAQDHAADTSHDAVVDHAVDTAHDAAADHGGGHATGKSSVIEQPKQGVIPAFTAIIIFLIVLGISWTMIWPKIVAGLDDRNDKIVGEIAAAEDARKQAKEALAQYEQNLADARAESQQMLEDTKAQQASLAANLKATADAELSAMREKAVADIDAAKKQALSELYSQSVNLATVMASKILAREVTVDDQQKLMDESLAEMKSVNC